MKKKVVWLPYDMDTAIGINNEGSLVFSYNLEDTDHVGNSDVYNGQGSVFWNNLRLTYADELKEMYQTLRTARDTLWAYDKIEERFEEHQSKWPEAVFNEDAWFKYLQPLVDDNDGGYLGMLQGSKAEQRKWWLYNRFRYLDSKYNTGDAKSNFIFLRGYAIANLSVTPYADIYATVKWGSYILQQRAARNETHTFVCPLDNVNDTETEIYSAPQIASVGDLSGYQVGEANFTSAIKLQNIKIGDASSSYQNIHFTKLLLGNNTLLKTIDCRNCVNLGTSTVAGSTPAPDLSGCTGLEEAYFEGTQITGIQFANGGFLKTAHLPATVLSLQIFNQPHLTDLSIPSYSQLRNVALVNVGNAVDEVSIINQLANGTNVRFVGFSWQLSNVAALNTLKAKLDLLGGLNEDGTTTMDTAQLQGTIHVPTMTGAAMAAWNEDYPSVTFTYEHITATLTYYNYDGSSVLHTETVTDGGDGTYTGSPSRSSTAQYDYTFAGWALSANGSANSNALKNVTSDRPVYAAYTSTIRKYTVYFYNGSTLLQTVNDVPYGGSATYTGSTPTSSDGDFLGWNPKPTNITGNTSCYAQFQSPAPECTITDSWDDIFAAELDGTYKTKYAIGDTINLDVGSEGIVNAQIAAFDVEGAKIVWITEQPLKTDHRMNPALVTNYKYESEPSFKRYSTTASNTGYNQWNSQNAYTANNIAKITLNITAVADGTLRLKYVTGVQASYTASLKVNGTNVVSSYSSSTQNYDLSITNGTTYEIVYEVTTLNNTSSTNTYIKLCNTSDSGSNSDVSALVTQNSVQVENCSVRSIDDYDEGTGTIGGWEKSEMRTYLSETVYPLIQSDVRSHIIEMTKYSYAHDTTGSGSAGHATADKIWIPSRGEVANTAYDGSNEKYNTLFPDQASRVKTKVGASSAAFWWLRSSGGTTNFYYVNSSGSVTLSNAYASYGVVFGFGT